MAEANITVSIERTLHDALANVLQQIATKHRIRVESLSARWSDRIDGTATLTDLRIESSTTGHRTERPE